MENSILLEKLIAAINNLDKDDVKEWITVKGNHIPILEGQTEDEAVQAFIEEHSTGGYSDRNKSNRSIAAELEGKDNATILAKKLGISTKEAALLWSDEWHHTNKNYTKTKYYYTDAYLDLQKNGEISQKTIDKYDLNNYQILGIKESWNKFIKRNSSNRTRESVAQELKKLYNNERVNEAIDEALSRKKKVGLLASSIRNFLPDILEGNKEDEEHLKKEITWFINQWNKKAKNDIGKPGYNVEPGISPDIRSENATRYQDVLLNDTSILQDGTSCQEGYTKMEITASNAIYLGEETGGKGRQFKARFLVPGLVKYDYGVCLLTKENADKFMQGFIGCPVVINHQKVTDNNVKDIAVGDIFSVWFDEKDGYYWCNGIIRDKEAIKLIDEGYSVSCQYLITECSDNTTGALHNGNPYDKIIENGKPEHLAIVNKPRYEGAIIAVNAIMAENADKWITIHPNGEENKGKHLLIKDGESVEDAMHRNGWYEKRQAKEEKGEETKLLDKVNTGSIYKSKTWREIFEKRLNPNESKSWWIEKVNKPSDGLLADDVFSHYQLRAEEGYRTKIPSELNDYIEEKFDTSDKYIYNPRKKEEKASNSFIDQFKDTLYEVLAEGIYNRLIAVNGWVTLDRIDEETGERVKIYIGGDEAASYHSKWFDDDIDEFKKSKEMKIKLDSLQHEVKNTILSTVNDINKQFKIKDLVSVSTGPLQRAYAFNLTDMKHNAIRVSKKKFEDLEKLKTSFNRDCDVLFHPKGLKDADPVKAIIMHELGHSITVAGGTSEFWNEIETIRTKHNKELGVSSYKTYKKGKGKYNTQNMISSYALYNQYEFVAEGFADAMLSKTPCKYSKDVLKCIEKHFEITGQKQKQLRLFNAIMEAVNAMSNEKKKNEEQANDNLFLENFGLGYPSEEEFDKWIDEQEEN